MSNRKLLAASVTARRRSEQLLYDPRKHLWSAWRNACRLLFRLDKKADHLKAIEYNANLLVEVALEHLGYMNARLSNR
jgi:hypothetical protein